jgi:hypothetical protein
MGMEVHIDDFSREQWEQCANLFADYSIYQTWPYQQVRAETDGQNIMRMIVTDEQGSPVIMCHLRIKDIKLLGIRIGYVQSGPLMMHKSGRMDGISAALGQLHDSCLRAGINILRVVPNLRNDETGKKTENLLEDNGFRKNPKAASYNTFIVSLKDSEEEMLCRIHRDSRRVIRNAEKKQIEIREGVGPEFFEILENLYAAAKERKGFRGLDSVEFAKTQQMLSQNDKAIVLVAYYQGQPVTAHATTHFGITAVPILTASNETGLSCGTSYLLWWKAYLAAKKLGMIYYDLGGVDEHKNPKGYLFKKRMGGEETFYIGAFESCNNLRAKAAWRMAETTYGVVKKYLSR